MTRQQQSMKLALEHIAQVSEASRSEGKEKVKNSYGSLCHWFPIVVRTNGLCQALAYVNDKGRIGNGPGGQTDDLTVQASAYRFLWTHTAAVLGKDPSALLNHVRTASTADYLRDTRTLLSAWVFYKRFAASILDVAPGEKLEEIEEE